MEAGVGVDLRDMEACLFRMKKHILTAQEEHTKTGFTAKASGDSDRKKTTNKDKEKAKTTAASKLSALAGMCVVDKRSRSSRSQCIRIS